jgi:hypothetical protein
METYWDCHRWLKGDYAHRIDEWEYVQHISINGRIMLCGAVKTSKGNWEQSSRLKTDMLCKRCAKKSNRQSAY